jgi:hypothetical protein
VTGLSGAHVERPSFFTEEEFVMLNTLTELIIPADEHSPGARAVGVAAYIDRVVAEAFLPEDQLSWRRGLAAVDRFSVSSIQKAFNTASGEEQIILLTQIAKNEKNPETAAERFFLQLKQTTAFAYYTSSVGIHREMSYQGNVLLPEFVGYDAT